MDLMSIISKAESRVFESEEKVKKYPATSSIICMVDLDVEFFIISSDLGEKGGVVEFGYSDSKLADALFSTGEKTGEFAEVCEVCSLSMSGLIKMNITREPVEIKSWEWVKPGHLTAQVVFK